MSNGKTIGKVTSAVYSPRLEQNIALAIVSIEFSKIGSVVEILKNSEKRCISSAPHLCGFLLLG